MAAVARWYDMWMRHSPITISSLRLRLVIAGCAMALAVAAQSGMPGGLQPETAPTPVPPSFKANGIFVRSLRLRLVPYHTQAFEALMRRCVAAAASAALPESHEWLCYRESPGRYWIITFSETRDGFACPPSFAGFVASIAGAESEEARREATAMLDDLEYETEWWMLTRQKTEWSTVESMSTATHPMARAMVRTIRPGMAEEFDAALTARTAFLHEHGYPLPVEGFVTLDASPPELRHAAMQVVFPVDWPSFHASESFGAFVGSLDPVAQEVYAARKAALMRTMSRAEFYDGSYAPELRYDTD